MRIAQTFSLFALLGLPMHALAERVGPFDVVRSSGAEICPDADALAMLIELIRGRPSRDLATTYSIVFARTEDGFAATIHSGQGTSGVRTLESRSANCSAVGNATAVTLALLFDSDIEEKSRQKTVSPPAFSEPKPIAPVPVAIPAVLSRQALLGIGAVGLLGVVRSFSPALSAEGGVASGVWRASVGALWLFPQTLALGPGSVHERLWAGTARACLAPWQGPSLRFDLCTGVLLGAVTAEADGYSKNEQRTRAWFAVPVEAALLGFLATPVAAEIGIGALVPLRRPDFAIDGVGTAYASQPLGAMLSLRMYGVVPW